MLATVRDYQPADLGRVLQLWDRAGGADRDVALVAGMYSQTGDSMSSRPRSFRRWTTNAVSAFAPE
jgi:hypothetical protein